MIINCTVCGRPLAELDDDVKPSQAQGGILRRFLSGVGVDLDVATIAKMLEPQMVAGLVNVRHPGGCK